MTYKETYNDTTDTIVDRLYALPRMGEIGELKWELCMAVGIAWILVLAALGAGLRSYGKVVIVSVPVAYVLMCAIFARSLALDNAFENIT